MNIMIANLSLIGGNGTRSEVVYKWNYDNNDPDINAIQTNEAATKLYIWWLENIKNEHLDKIIYVASKEVTENRIKYSIGNAYLEVCEYGTYDMSCADFYKARINEYCNNNNFDKIKFVQINSFSDNNEKTESSDSMEYIITNCLNEIIKEIGDNKCNLYIDTTGGRRDQADTIQLLLKFLTYKKNVNIEMPIYSELISILDKEEKKKKSEGVFWKVDVYDLLKVLDGVNQFVTTGRSDIMKEALEGECLYNSENINIIEKILDATGAFSDSMLLCQTKDLDDVLIKINKSLKAFEEQVKNEAKKSNKLVIFENMIPIIREKFFFTEGKENKVNYPEMVKWCLDNGLIQQALTIYVEKIPKFLNERIFDFSKKQSDDGSAEAEYLYKTVLDTDNFYNEKVSNMEEEYEKIKKDTEAIKRLLYKRDKNDNKELCKFLELLEKQQYLITESNENEAIKKFNIEKLKKDSIVNSKKVPKNNVKIFKDIMNNKSGIIKVYDNEKNKKIDSISKRTYIVENLENCTNITNENIKNEKFSLDDVKAILYSYIYAKAIRNGINHASDNEIFTPENMGKYIDLEYEGAKEPKKLTVENVKNDMLKAYKNLKKECEN